MATVLIKEINDIIITISKYIDSLIRTLYTRIKPMVIDEIKSIATIRSLIVGPLISLSSDIPSAIKSNAKEINKTIFNRVDSIFYFVILLIFP